jgi:hypothetical protein
LYRALGLAPSGACRRSTIARQPDDVKNREFLGGPARLFEQAGREPLIALLEHGLTFSSTVLDIECGVLRGGRWIIPLLDSAHYCGIEPQRHLVERGLAEFVDPAVVELKRPRFDHNDLFDFSVFDTRFIHFMARLVWTHAAKPHIEATLDGVAATGALGASLLASYLPAPCCPGERTTETSNGSDGARVGAGRDGRAQLRVTPEDRVPPGEGQPSV